MMVFTCVSPGHVVDAGRAIVGAMSSMTSALFGTGAPVQCIDVDEDDMCDPDGTG